MKGWFVMKPRFSKSERGQGCVEIIVGITIIVVIVTAIIGALTEMAARIKKNIVDIQATPPVSVVETTDRPVIKISETAEPEISLPVPEITEITETAPPPVLTMSIENLVPVSSITPLIETQTAEPVFPLETLVSSTLMVSPSEVQTAEPIIFPNQPKKSIWEKFLDWLNK